jgi:hypothetical protein
VTGTSKLLKIRHDISYHPMNCNFHNQVPRREKRVEGSWEREQNKTECARTGGRMMDREILL